MNSVVLPVTKLLRGIFRPHDKIRCGATTLLCGVQVLSVHGQALFYNRNASIEADAIGGEPAEGPHPTGSAGSTDLNRFQTSFSFSNPGDPGRDIASRQAAVSIDSVFSANSYRSSFSGSQAQGNQSGMAGGLAYSSVGESFSFHLETGTNYLIEINLAGITADNLVTGSLATALTLSDSSGHALIDIAFGASDSSYSFARTFSGSLPAGDYSLSYHANCKGLGFPSSANYSGEILLSVPASPPPAIEATIAPAVEISWRSISNRLYRVEWTDQLTETNNLRLLADQIAGNGTANHVFDSTRISPRRFYRVTELDSNSPGHPKKFIWGVAGHAHDQRPDSRMDLPGQFALMQDLGVSAYRFGVTEANVKDASGQYDFSSVERILNEASARNIQLVPDLFQDLRPGYTNLPASDFEQRAKAFGISIASHFGERIRYYELDGELDTVLASKPGSRDAIIATLKGLSEGIKIGYSNALTIVNTGGNTSFLMDMVQSGVTFDVSGVHRYPKRDTINDLRSDSNLVALGKPVWVTEFDRHTGSAGGLSDLDGEELQAGILRVGGSSLFTTPLIEAVFVYELFDQNDQVPDERAYGLVTVEGSGENWLIGHRKASFSAYQERIASATALEASLRDKVKAIWTICYGTAPTDDQLWYVLRNWALSDGGILAVHERLAVEIPPLKEAVRLAFMEMGGREPTPEEIDRYVGIAAQGSRSVERMRTAVRDFFRTSVP